ncbi:MAG TPA: transglutaminaseTgpA domain-containing protein, partial [Pseudonocardia sp.]
MTATGSRYLVPISAGVAVALSSTALSGVVQGYDWLWHTLLALALVVLLGLAVRAVRLPVAIAVPVQLTGLALLITGFYGQHAVFGVLPDSSTVSELVEQLGKAFDQIESGVPPVPTTPALSLLVTLGFGLVMVAVDPLAMAGHGPAACGLVLLGGYTVPTALSPDALPAWTLVLCAVGYAQHLMIWQRERLARRGILATPAGTPPTTGAELARRRLRAARRAGTGPSVAVALTGIALLVALGLGSLATFIGTDGRFAGHGHGHNLNSGTEFGLQPFATLRGELDKAKPAELFRVRGLPGPEYLRALTLTRYSPSDGWQLPDRRNGVDMNGTLPSGIGVPVDNPTATIQIENVNFRDRWLPLFGLPMSVTGQVPGRWQYDVITNTAYTDQPTTEPTWTERAGLPDPNLAALLQRGPTEDVDPTYLDTDGVDPKITELARAITRNAASPFSKAVTLNRYFLDPANGFRYNLKTAPGSTNDALMDFLFWGKTGYCEQFASAMAVMLRSIGVPARVAIGFTAGDLKDDYRSIGTGDAHAWVEGYFHGVGWLTFDPTPLGDGRTALPSYVANAPEVPVKVPPSALDAGQRPSPSPDQPGPDGQPQPKPKPSDQGQQQPRPSPGPGQSPSQTGGNQNNASGQSPTQPGPGPTSNGGKPGGDNGGGDQNNPDKPKNKPIAGIVLAGAVLVLLLVLLGLLILGLIAATPSSARALVRHRRLASAARGGTDGAEAAWRELLAEFQDRGASPAPNETVRRSARRLAKAHRLDSAAVTGVKTVVGAVEHGWYAPPDSPD